MSVLLLRRRAMMQQIGHRYNVDWYPIVQGPVTLKDMIAELGDLMQTYDDAPATWNGTTKTSAFALAKGAASAKFGGNIPVKCILYEEGQSPRYISSVQTITFASTETYKHVVHYNTNLGGNQTLAGVRWVITETNINLYAQLVTGVKYWHIPYNRNVSVSVLYNINNPNPTCYSGSVYYIPDWWGGQLYPARYKQCAKLRFSKGVTLYNSIYFFGNHASEMPNLTDIYVHWGLGEVINQPFNRFTGQWKLHIPDLGNAEDNAALVAEYRSKGWNYVAGKGILNDVEIAEPKEILI